MPAGERARALERRVNDGSARCCFPCKATVPTYDAAAAGGWRAALRRSRSGCGLEVGVERAGGFGLVAGHEVAVAVEGDRDARVAEVGRERFGVDTAGD